MRSPLARFDLHEWHTDNEAKARFTIGASGIARADIRPFCPRSATGWQRLWSTPPNDLIADILRRLGQAYGFEPGELVLTEGASEADFLAPLALVGPGEHVVVEQPAYFALVEPARALGCRVTRVPRLPEAGFALDPARVEAAITKRTRLVCLARPHNPTGHRVPDRDLVRIADAARRVGAHVLVDEVFAEATEVGDVPARSLGENILSVNSVTKCLGFGPLHLGWIAAPPDVARRLHRAKAHTRPLNPTLSLGIAARVIARRRSLLAKTRARRAANAATVRRYLATDGALEGVLLDHGTTMVLRMPQGVRDDVGFSKRLLERTGTLVSPGSFLELPGWVRIGLLSQPAALGAGLRHLVASA